MIYEYSRFVCIYEGLAFSNIVTVVVEHSYLQKRLKRFSCEFKRIG